MIPSDTGDRPPDVEELAALARNKSLSQDERRQALQGLRLTVRCVARRVAARYPGSYLADVVDESLGVIWGALNGYQSGRPFEPWCYGVLKNHLIEQLRKEQAEWRRRQEASAKEGTNTQDALERALDRSAPFGSADLDELADWSLPQRLALLCLSGLWEKVPPQLWRAWVQEYENLHRADLRRPFPPESLEDANTVPQRNEILANLLRVERNTLSVWLYRYKDRLGALAYVRAVLDAD